MSFGSVRGILCTLLVLAGLWILFLITAQLLLDIEQGRKYFDSLRLSQSDSNGNESASLEELIYSETTDDEDELSCEIPEDKSYPDCRNRVEILRNNWEKNPCYMEYDVDGTTCSLIIYLSEVESWCPRLTWRKYMKKKERRREKAVMPEKPDKLLSMLKSMPGFQPIRSRISIMWHYWQDGLHFMQTKHAIDMRSKKKILLFIGSLMDAVPSNQSSKLTDELLQWSDLLASLTILGHDVFVKTDRVELFSLLSEGSQLTHRGCEKEHSGYDLIYIDIPGLQQLVTSMPDRQTRFLVWSKYSCYLRVLTPFGMDAEFNYRGNFGDQSQVGNWNLNLKQFLVKYPLSADNSFLGFAVRSLRNETLPSKSSMTFVDGDTARDFKAHKHYLKAIYKQTRMHSARLSTEGLKDDLAFIVNHANIELDTVKELLRKSKLFIGLGSPHEKALALEALAQGCIVMNPKFIRPKNRLNSEALRQQPSSRNLTSEHPYLEQFVGKPFVYTVDIRNKAEVMTAMKEILKKQILKPFVPFEFTCEGMLERLNAYVENQNFCDMSDHWPSNTGELEITIARAGTSCTEACSKAGFTCEPEYFHLLNASNITSCAEKISEESIVAPAIEEDTARCVIQKQKLLYSCAGHHSKYKRFCPCREYRNGQIGLCKSCF
ncbi:alpha-1,6-mannosylglycoprotein 6-beta-N-acetylglucosaminyltransferase A-like [Montipora foliosa]|uniref:alpha-1,6-mannosylglycoprotein 6-beta-N-acetylglucosaminyltransferase A-like n=1 Tax=Montipora foliosa TaxID=591990 RepID=UPI0035F1D531